MNQSEAINELATALSAAQGEIQNAEKSSDNPFFGSKYADLAEVLNQTRPVASAHGLSVSQFPFSDGDDVGVESILMHSSGQWMKSKIQLPIQDFAEGELDNKGNQKHVNWGQESGKILTYLRRYSIAAIFGIAQEDVDGNINGAPGKPKKEVKDKPWFNEKPHLEKMRAEFTEAIVKGERTPEQIVRTLRENFRVSSKMADAIDGLCGPNPYNEGQDAPPDDPF